ncbi:hypothetical protein [Thauera aromatica]|uniref:hypothetical protein n=1 Tax=Thauera aromatica TaxID=59405 RepID=UPI001FFDB838|nr:hypothetical protein [Thauera aromatica]MCK2097534.1 hypothetical protein [Thauera aromatica]
MSFARPSDEHAYRVQTTRQAKMPGVTRPSFRCSECGYYRGTAGRQKTASGWRCAACKRMREARAEQKMAEAA